MRYRVGCTYGYAEGDYQTDVLYLGCACGNFFGNVYFALGGSSGLLRYNDGFFVTTPLIIAARAATHLILLWLVLISLSVIQILWKALQPVSV